MITVRLSSFLDPPDLELMAIWMLERPVVAAIAGDRGKAALDAHAVAALALVHAVEKPLRAPGVNVPCSRRAAEQRRAT
jgi:hypothetical protein